MSVGVMKDYKRRDLHASHTLFIMNVLFYFSEEEFYLFSLVMAQ
jgi:hypothetical protein